MIAIDWGTTGLRAFRLDPVGQLLDVRRSMQGVLACNGNFAEVLAKAIEGWDDRVVVMAGMIGSRQGWQEAPYIACPARLDDLAAGMMRLADDSLPGHDLWIVPGLSVASAGRHDVMRGEETQLCGMLGEIAQGVHMACLPGTHSKLALVEDGCVKQFWTALTGEMFALLCQRSILGRLMDGQDFHQAAFVRGVDDARTAGDLLRHLFAVRTHGLFGTLQPDELSSYLSGLLIGHELNDLPELDLPVRLVAAGSLVEPYRTALNQRGYRVVVEMDGITAKGLHRLAKARGLVPA